MTIRRTIVAAAIGSLVFLIPPGQAGGARNALQFDGVNDVAVVPDSTTLDLSGAMTLECWVQLTSREPIRDQWAVGKRYAYYIYSEASAYGGTGNWKGHVWAPGHTDCFGTTHLAAGQWYHLAVTYDGSHVRAYVNGQPENDLPHTGQPSQSDYNLSFGMEDSTGQYALHGMLEEGRVWNVARTEMEIQANHDRTVDPSTPGLVGYWNFDEPGGQYIYDRTGNGSDGTLGMTDAVGNDDPLRVTSTAPIAQQVAVDVRPHQETNRVNTNSNAPVQVAILGSETLDVNDVDVASLALDGAAVREKGSGDVFSQYKDVNKDDYLDLLGRFTASELVLDPGATEIELIGSLLDGTPIFGSDAFTLGGGGQYFTLDDTGSVAIPEPATLGLVMLGGLALMHRTMSRIRPAKVGRHGSENRRQARQGLSALMVALLAVLATWTVPASLASAELLGPYSFVPLPGVPHDVVYDAGRGLAYVSNRNLSQIDVVRLSDNAVLTPISLQHPGYGMTLTEDASQLLVTFYNHTAVGLVDLSSMQQTQTWTTPSGGPLRIDRDSEGRIYWRTGSPGGPYGYAYQLDFSSGASTRVFAESQFQPYLKYSYSNDRREWLLMIESPKAAVWDAPCQTSSPVVNPEGFGYGWWAWISTGMINNLADTIVLSKSGAETRIYDGSFVQRGMLNVGIAYGSFGDLDDLALVVELQGDETPSNRVSVLDTDSMAIVETLTLPQRIGMSEFNCGTQPIDLALDRDLFLAVGQTGLYAVDISDFPKPVLEVAIDISPHQEAGRINTKSNGPVQVAILGSETLDVNDVDLASLALDGAAVREKGSGDVFSQYKDVDKDGFLDLIARFTASELVLEPGATEIELTGSLLDGTPILGVDSVRLLVPGDANLDGLTDAQDFSILKGNFGRSPAKLALGDFNEDGVVDGQDFSILKTYFGQGTPPAASPVPEPAALTLLAVGALAMIRRRVA